MTNMVYALERQLQPKLQFSGSRLATGQHLQSSAVQPACSHSSHWMSPMAIPDGQARQGMVKHPAQKWPGSACQMLHHQQPTRTGVKLTGRGYQLQAAWKPALREATGLQTSQVPIQAPEQLVRLQQQQQQQQQKQLALQLPEQCAASNRHVTLYDTKQLQDSTPHQTAETGPQLWQAMSRDPRQLPQQSAQRPQHRLPLPNPRQAPQAP